jgi:AcrR family transcriptional regulator
MTAVVEGNQVTRKPATKKSEETRAKILEAALAVFRERGFESATMREIAAKAEVAVGAAYYYFDSKEAIVMAFYGQAQSEMHAAIERQLSESKTLETRLRSIISVKLNYFNPNRKLLGALSAHSDPHHPLSPFSAQTAPIREQDIGHFVRAVDESAVKLPKRIRPYLPRLLWLYQMGLILFWVYDSSLHQRRTQLLFEKTLQMILLTLRFANLPILLPMHRLAADVLDGVYGEAASPPKAETRLAGKERTP